MKKYLLLVLPFLFLSCFGSSDPIKHTGIFAPKEQKLVENYLDALISDAEIEEYLLNNTVDEEIRKYEIFDYKILRFYPDAGAFDVCTVRISFKNKDDRELPKLYKIMIMDEKICKIF